jgi:hypothetical protein
MTQKNLYRISTRQRQRTTESRRIFGLVFTETKKYNVNQLLNLRNSKALANLFWSQLASLVGDTNSSNKNLSISLSSQEEIVKRVSYPK